MTIPEFGWIEPWLARGGEPISGPDYRELFKQGARILVNLRTRDLSAQAEKHCPRLLNVHVPVKNHRPPGEDEAIKWLELCDVAARRLPIFVHCEGGPGRTSTFRIILRLAQGWELERAIDGQRRFHFNPDEEKKQTNFLRDFAAKVETAKLELPRIAA
jgi:protein-tyrosine phosphatase